MARYLFGTPVMTLSEVIAELNIAQNNTKETHYASNLVHAKWVWKELLWTNVWSVAQVPVDIVDGKITLPNDVIRLVNISVMDKCGNLQPLGHNPNINTLDVRCPVSKCGCQCGGVDTYCMQVDNITTTKESIVINGENYTKTIYTRSDNKGNIYQQSHTPTWDVTEEEVVYIDTTELICKVDVTETGCIKATEPNRLKLTQFCGCYIPYGDYPDYSYLSCDSPYWNNCGDWRNRRDCQLAVPEVTNNFGYYNWDAKANDIVHIKHTKADRVIVSYQTSGETANEEMLVPEYALSAMLAGIYYRQVWLAPPTVIPRNEKREAKYAYQAEKTSLFEFQHPLRIDEFVKSQNIRPWW